MNKEEILNTCKQIARRGEVFHVNKFRWAEDKKRKNCFQLKKRGLLKQLPNENKMLRFYRPEDEGKLNSARKKQDEKMRSIYRKNCRTMIELARKSSKDDNGLVGYYLKEFWKYKDLSWHYETGEVQS